MKRLRVITSLEYPVFRRVEQVKAPFSWRSSAQPPMLWRIVGHIAASYFGYPGEDE